MTIRASEFEVKPTTQSLTYMQRRLIELVAKGMAVERQKRPTKSPEEKARTRMANDFRERLKRVRCAFVYFIPSANGISVRKIHPAAPDSRKVIGPAPLPPDAIFVGRYVYPASKTGFLKDLDEAMEEAKCTN